MELADALSHLSLWALLLVLVVDSFSARRKLSRMEDDLHELEKRVGEARELHEISKKIDPEERGRREW